MPSSSLRTHHEARGHGEHVGDGVLHRPRLLVQVDVPQHHAVHQGAQQEVDVPDQDHAQAHLHQGFGLLQGAATHPWEATWRSKGQKAGYDIQWSPGSIDRDKESGQNPKIKLPFLLMINC